MATILKKKPTTPPEMLNAIIKIAGDKHERILKDDQIEWLETKLAEIGRLARKLKREGVVW